MDILLLLTSGIIGIFIGGLLNVLADDLPPLAMTTNDLADDLSPSSITTSDLYDEDEDGSDGNSAQSVPIKITTPHYTDGTPRPLSAWLGITAFLFGQRTPPNSTTQETVVPLSWRYPITEIATSILLVISVARIMSLNTVEPITTLQSLFWLYYVLMFILIIIIDVEHHLILFVVIIPSALIALIDAVLTPTQTDTIAFWMANIKPDLLNALIGGAVGFGTFYLFYLGGFLYTRASAELRGEHIDDVAFGYGDVMLSGLCGLILGWQALIISIFITVFLGAFGALAFLIFQKIRYSQNDLFVALPYGPYIVISAFIMLFFSDYVRQFLFDVAF